MQLLLDKVDVRELLLRRQGCHYLRLNIGFDGFFRMIEVVVTDTLACLPDSLYLLLTWVAWWFQIVFAVLRVLDYHRAMMGLRC